MNKDFFLGILVAIALLLLWRKEHKSIAAGAAPGAMPVYLGGNGAGASSDAGCGGDCAHAAIADRGPSFAASPASPDSMDVSLGMVSPSAPPLGGAGTVPSQTTYMSQIRLWKAPITAPVSSYPPQPASEPAPRAVATLPTYSEWGFVNRASARNLGTGRMALTL